MESFVPPVLQLATFKYSLISGLPAINTFYLHFLCHLCSVNSLAAMDLGVNIECSLNDSNVILIEYNPQRFYACAMQIKHGRG